MISDIKAYLFEFPVPKILLFMIEAPNLFISALRSGFPLLVPLFVTVEEEAVSTAVR